MSQDGRPTLSNANADANADACGDATAPWYADGLAFACTGCGGCCTGAPGYVWVTDEELQAIADHLGRPVAEVRLADTKPARGKVSLRDHANGDCVYFNPSTRRCTVYPVRPKQCRTWPFWPENLRTVKTWAAVARECPGIGRGEIVPLETVKSIARDAGLPFQSLDEATPADRSEQRPPQ